MRMFSSVLFILVSLAALPTRAQQLTLQVPTDSPIALGEIAKDLCAEPPNADPKRQLEATTCLDCKAGTSPVPGLTDLKSIATDPKRIQRDLDTLEYINARELFNGVIILETAAYHRQKIKEKTATIAEYRGKPGSPPPNESTQKTIDWLEERVARHRLDLKEAEAKEKKGFEARLAALEKHYGKLVTLQTACGLTAAEAAALHTYTIRGYERINRALRAGGPELAAAQNFIATMEAAMKKIKPFQGQVIRGIVLPDDRLAAHEVGKVVTYPGFTSASLGNNKHFGKEKHQFIIQSKTGRFVGYHSQFLDEYEVLFPAGTKFRILSREPGSDGRINFVMEEVD